MLVKDMTGPLCCTAVAGNLRRMSLDPSAQECIHVIIAVVSIVVAVQVYICELGRCLLKLRDSPDKQAEARMQVLAILVHKTDVVLRIIKVVQLEARK